MGLKSVDVHMLGGRVVKMMVSDKKDFSTALQESKDAYASKDNTNANANDDMGKKILSDHQRRMRLYGAIM